MTKHTPTPWEYELYQDEEGIPDEQYIYSGNDEICSLSGNNAKANAEFIVHAVNMHDELIEALKSAVDALDALGYKDIKYYDDFLSQAERK